jgi:F-type H+-transporting ATPase subunit b
VRAPRQRPHPPTLPSHLLQWLLVSLGARSVSTPPGTPEKSHWTPCSPATGAARLRPSLPLRTFPSIAAQARYNSNVPQEDPKKKAQSLMESIPVPGNSPLTKAAVLSAGAGLSVAAISNELYVVNEESIVALSLLTIFWAVAKYAGPAWGEYAQQQADKISGILNAARADHTSAVKSRIQSVQDLGGVIDITKTLFEVSKARQTDGD